MNRQSLRRFLIMEAGVNGGGLGPEPRVAARAARARARRCAARRLLDFVDMNSRAGEVVGVEKAAVLEHVKEGVVLGEGLLVLVPVFRAVVVVVGTLVGLERVGALAPGCLERASFLVACTARRFLALFVHCQALFGK